MDLMVLSRSYAQYNICTSTTSSTSTSIPTTSISPHHGGYYNVQLHEAVLILFPGSTTITSN